MDPASLVKSVAPLFGAVGAAYYFVPETLAVGKALGLGGMPWYLMGRAGVLGDVEAPVVASAFGYFHPDTVASLWAKGRASIGPREAGHRYHECAAEFGRRKYASIDRLDAFNAAAEKVIRAAHPAGFALFAGIAAEPLAADAPGRAQQLATVLREHRGSAHLVAVLASGLTPEEAHFLRRPEMYKGFGYDEATPPAVDDSHRERLDTAERLTDALVLPAFSVLDEAEGAALLAGARAMQAALA